MLSIDLKPSNLNPQKIFHFKQAPSSTSLNRVQRLRELVRVNEENKVRLRLIIFSNCWGDSKMHRVLMTRGSGIKTMITIITSLTWLGRTQVTHSIIDIWIGRYCRHPYFIQTPSMGLLTGSQMGDAYSSVQSGRTLSAKPMERGHFFG